MKLGNAVIAIDMCGLRGSHLDHFLPFFKGIQENLIKSKNYGLCYFSIKLKNSIIFLRSEKFYKICLFPSRKSFKKIYVGKMQYLNIQKIGTRKNYDSGQGNNTTQELENLRGINTNNNYTNITNKSDKKSNSYIGRNYAENFFDSLYANNYF